MGEIHLPHCHCDNENKIIKCMPSVEDCSSMADTAQRWHKAKDTLDAVPPRGMCQQHSGGHGDE